STVFGRSFVTPMDYEYLRKLLKERSGLDLSADKQYLLESRLVPLARRVGVTGIPELVQKIRGGGADVLTAEVVEAMTTNETFFFRDKIPFDHLREILPALMQARANRRSLRIWSAACSTGQEPYSIAMLLKEAGQVLAGWRTEIVATDLSQGVLEKTKAAIFERMVKQLEPDGMLMLGAAESVVGITDAFKPYPEKRGLYRPNLTRTGRPIGIPPPMPQALKVVASARC